MRVRAIDGNNDFLFGKGESDYLVNSNAVGQNIKTELQSFLGDCFFDAQLGIDWFNLLGSKNQLALQVAVTTVILGVDGVTSLASPVVINLDPVTRNIFIQYSVNTIYTGNAGLVSGATNIFLLTEGGDNLTDESGNALEGG